MWLSCSPGERDSCHQPGDPAPVCACVCTVDSDISLVRARSRRAPRCVHNCSTAAIHTVCHATTAAASHMLELRGSKGEGIKAGLSGYWRTLTGPVAGATPCRSVTEPSVGYRSHSRNHNMQCLFFLKRECDSLGSVSLALESAPVRLARHWESSSTSTRNAPAGLQPPLLLSALTEDVFLSVLLW